MGHFIIGLSGLLLTFTLTGCKKELAEPETLDPIYADLVRRMGEAQKWLDDEVKKQGELRAKIDRADPGTIEKKFLRRDLLKSEHASLEAKQDVLYYQIRSNRRKLVDRITYKAAFAQGEAWPDAAEYSQYKVNNRLREANRNWGARVPRMTDRVVSSVPKEEPAKEEKKGH